MAVLVAELAVLFNGWGETNDVVKGKALEGPLIKALLLTLVQAVHRLQPLYELLPHPGSAPHLSEVVSCGRIASGPSNTVCSIHTTIPVRIIQVTRLALIP